MSLSFSLTPPPAYSFTPLTLLSWALIVLVTLEKLGIDPPLLNDLGPLLA